MWLDSKAVNCPQKWGNFRGTIGSVLDQMVHANSSDWKQWYGRWRKDRVHMQKIRTRNSLPTNAMPLNLPRLGITNEGAPTKTLYNPNAFP